MFIILNLKIVCVPISSVYRIFKNCVFPRKLPAENRGHESPQHVQDFLDLPPVMPKSSRSHNSENQYLMKI